MGRVKWNYAFLHEQNAQIKIHLAHAQNLTRPFDFH